MENQPIKRYTKESGELPTYSYGTSPVIDEIDRLGEFGNFKYDSIVIDASTIVRNVISDHLTDPISIIRDNMNLELSNMISSITYAAKHSGMVNVTIIIYFTNYVRALPKEILKDKLNKLNNKVQSFVLSELTKDGKNKDIKVDGNTTIYQRMFRTGQIENDLKQTLSQLKNQRKLLMLSHMPYPYHIINSYPNLHVIYSHTAEIHDKSAFSKKVFKNPDMPFYHCTHMFFGDSIFVKGIGTLKQKKLAKKAAIDDSWNTHTQAYVKEELDKILKEVK